MLLGDHSRLCEIWKRPGGEVVKLIFMLLRNKKVCI